MARHVFLTGEIQVGKSTAIRKFLAATGIAADGFLSHIITAQVGRELYLARYDTALGESDSRLAARVNYPEVEVFPEIFDLHGAELVRSAGAHALIIMDELGTMEEVAEEFKRAVFERLDGGVPILGVVKKRDSPFLDAVRAHGNVEVITVTEENRDEIPALLADKFAYLR